MKFALKSLTLALLLCGWQPLSAQVPNPTDVMGAQNDQMSAGNENQEPPIDDIVERRTVTEKRILPYDHIRESDLLFQRRIWRVIDIREKMNLPFAYPERPFFTVLQDAAESGEITVYGTEDDKFTTPLSVEEVASMGASVDTVTTFDPETYEERQQIVTNELNPEDIKRYRVKEIWFFDTESSSLRVRILGIAPLKDEYDENGNFLYELPMFWVYYPDARKVLAKERAYAYGNDAANRTWEDIFESRFFSSYIYKESNVFDRRLQDYLTGIDLLMESDRIKREIFNMEHDLWEY